MVISGAGAGLAELVALAGAAEIVPTSKRGAYIAALVAAIAPWLPSVLYANLIAAGSPSDWRYVALLCLVWAGVGLVVLLVGYFPPPRPNSQGLNRTEILYRMDFVGGVLSIGGITLFDMALIWGGNTYPVSHERDTISQSSRGMEC